MLVIKVEIWPWGDKKKAREIARGFIWNDGTGTSETGNYGSLLLRPDVKIDHPDNVEKWDDVWQRNAVTGYNRRLCVWELVKKALVK